MSYSLNTKCFGCIKKDKCIDYLILESAVYCIHQIGTDRSHLGSGSIDLNCQNLEEPKVEDKE